MVKAADEFHTKTTAPNQLWQTDFTYLKVDRLGLVLPLDRARRLLPLHHRLEALHHAWRRATSPTRWSWPSPPRAATEARVRHRPRLLSDNGPSYIAGELAEWLADNGIEHVRGAPCHPQTQGKIERWHQTLKNRILLENYYLPGDLEAQVEAFVAHYNHQRYHESLSNLTPADVYFGRGQTILLERERIKRRTIQQRRLIHQRQAA